MHKRVILITIIALFSLQGCQTYYTKTLEFNKRYENRDYSIARDYLASQRKLKKRMDEVLYNLNYATSSFMMGDAETSIEYFAQADNYISDYRKKFGYEALALISNPSVRPYCPEYFEGVMVHFYQALNYINLSDYENAMVECRRMNLELEKISDSFSRHDGNRYSRDAFGHYLMGILYETNRDNNNAFIAYRNALQIYEEDYVKLFGTEVPDMLKQAIVRTAYRTGFSQEGRKYENKFYIKYDGSLGKRGRLVCFVLEGLSPIKEQSYLDMVSTTNEGFVSYSNSEYEITTPIFFSDCSTSERNSLKDFRAISISIPRYLSRGDECSASVIKVGSEVYRLKSVENIDKIAHQSLKDRMWVELGKAILRMLTKEVVRSTAANQNEHVGLLVWFYNLFSEQSDTRCWMSLPRDIKLLDIEIAPGEYELDYSGCGITTSASVTIESGKTTFLSFRGY